MKWLKKLINWLLKPKGPLATIRKWEAIIPKDLVISLIAEAETFTSYSNEEKKRYVAIRIAGYCKRHGLDVPDSVVNYFIELCIQLWKYEKGKKLLTPPL